MPEDIFTLSRRNTIEIANFPNRWVSLLNFFDPELPGFPLKRVHFVLDGTRVFGTPLSYSVDDSIGDECLLKVHVLSNVDLSRDSPAGMQFKQKLEERLGLSNALTMEDVMDCCRLPDGAVTAEHRKWRRIVELIFPRLKKYYGPKIPCGQFYPELDGVLRFISAWNTIGGRQQEYIMLNNVLQTIGKNIDNSINWALNFQLLPTYDEVVDNDYENFENFTQLRDAITEYGDQHLTNTYEVGDQTVYLLPPRKSVPTAGSRWDTLINPLSEETRKLITQLKEDFNRNYHRPFILIVYFYNLFKGLDFREWGFEDYVQIYNDRQRGMYPKVLGCILQQAFQKYGCIPVDVWVSSFFEELLRVPADEIPSSGYNLGKFERFIWYSVQLRKTNQPFFNDIIFCVKTGILHSTNIKNRGPNPLSCGLCAMRDQCPSYGDIEGRRVFVINRTQISSEDEFANSIVLNKPPMNIYVRQREYFNSDLVPPEDLETLSFIITSENGTAREVYIPDRIDNLEWLLTDDMSSFTANRGVAEGIQRVAELLH